MNTSPKHWLIAKFGDGSVLLSTSSSAAKLTHFGSSCPASIRPLSGNLTSFTIAPQQGKKGVVAIGLWEARPGKYEPNVELYYLLTVTYDPMPFVDLEAPFVSSADCLAQLTNDGLFVTAGEQRFVAPNFGYHSADVIARMKIAWTKQGIRTVDDPNLLCRFLVGDATIGEVQTAAEAFQEEEAWPAKFAALEKQLAEANGLITQLQSELSRTMRELELTIRTDSGRILDLQAAIEVMASLARNATFGKRRRALRGIADFGQIFLPKTPDPARIT